MNDKKIKVIEWFKIDDRTEIGMNNRTAKIIYLRTDKDDKNIEKFRKI